MSLSRRAVLAGVLPMAALGGLRAAGGRLEEEGEQVTFELYPVGTVEKKDDAVTIRIHEKYRDALLGLGEWSHVNVLYWFDKNDTPVKRSILRVHPRGKRENPLTGVFACRAPVRPNLLALSVCKVLSIEEGVITVDALDAFDGTPVLDLKPLIPRDEPRKDVRVPEWVGGKPGRGTEER